MAKLKIITLTMKALEGGNYEYKAIDDDGKVLATRVECLSCLGTTYIAAFVTQNTRDHTWRYSIRSLFTGFHRISRERATETMHGYALAVREDQKEAFEQWREAQRQAKKKVKTQASRHS